MQIPRINTRMISGNALFSDMTAFKKDPLKVFSQGAKETKGVYQLSLFPMKVIVVNDPALIPRVLWKNAKAYKRDPMTMRMVTSRSGLHLFTAEGKAWHTRRQGLQPSLRRKQVEHMFDEMNTSTSSVLEAKEGKKHLDAAHFQDVNHLLCMLATKLSADVLFKTYRNPDLSINKIDWLSNFCLGLRDYTLFLGERIFQVALIPKWLPTPVNQKMNKIYHQNLNFAGEIYAQRDSLGLAENDFLGRLQTLSEKEGFTPHQAHTEMAATLFAAQTSPTFNLGWAFYELAQNPKVMKKLEAEIQRVAPNGNLSLQQVCQMPYTNAVLKESMRLYPNSWVFLRKSIKEDQLGKFKIPKNSTVFVDSYSINRREEYWHKANEFRPERFIEDEIPEFFKPYGQGPRGCIGAHMAELMMTVMLVRLLQQYTFKVSPDFIFHPQQPTNLRFREGLPVKWQSRKGKTAPKQPAQQIRKCPFTSMLQAQ